jgi:TRAP-type C4-dicarboxylate transport system permease small subunit
MLLDAAATSNTDLCFNKAFIDALSQYYNIAIGLAIILAVIMVIVGGYQLVLSAGNPTVIEKGKKRIQNALFGLGLAVASFVFLNFLNPAIFHQTGCVVTSRTPPAYSEVARAA